MKQASSRRGSKHGMDREEYLLRIREFTPRGERVPSSKLTEAKVKEIRAMGAPWPRKSLASRYGVTVRTIDKLLSGETWTHVR